MSVRGTCTNSTVYRFIVASITILPRDNMDNRNCKLYDRSDADGGSNRGGMNQASGSPTITPVTVIIYIVVAFFGIYALVVIISIVHSCYWSFKGERSAYVQKGQEAEDIPLEEFRERIQDTGIVGCQSSLNPQQNILIPF